MQSVRHFGTGSTGGIRNYTKLVVFLLLSLFPLSTYAQESRLTPLVCTYEVSTWNVLTKGTSGTATIQKPYSKLSDEEIDHVTGCTVCSEDQLLIDIPPVKPFYVCYKIASDIHFTLVKLISEGEPVYSARGYRVIKSRGLIDEQGNRTEFSNHSFGTAIDINRETNGLYDQCLSFGPHCRLVLGGKWMPGVPGTLEADSTIVNEMKGLGFAWGGEIKGKQKDFMHFSFTGY
jgi:hypothetical protein